MAEAVDIVTGLLGGRLLLFAVQIYERTEPASRAALTTPFAWSATHVYDLNKAGFNRGLLLGTQGWTPRAGRQGLLPAERAGILPREREVRAARLD